MAEALRHSRFALGVEQLKSWDTERFGQMKK